MRSFIQITLKLNVFRLKFDLELIYVNKSNLNSSLLLNQAIIWSVNTTTATTIKVVKIILNTTLGYLDWL